MIATRRGRVLVLGLLSVLSVLVGTAAPAHAAVTLSAGHVDVLDVNYRSGTLGVKVLDVTAGAPGVERNPADVIFRVPVAAKTTVPSGSGFSFLGTPGSPVWVLPQSNTAGLLYAGWNAADVAGSVFAGSTLTFKLHSVSGGEFSVFTTPTFGGTPTVLFRSNNGLPDTQPVLAGAHTHANWAFKTAGTYTVTFEVYGTLAGTSTVKSSGLVAFTFQVLAS